MCRIACGARRCRLPSRPRLERSDGLHRTARAPRGHCTGDVEGHTHLREQALRQRVRAAGSGHCAVAILTHYGAAKPPRSRMQQGAGPAARRSHRAACPSPSRTSHRRNWTQPSASIRPPQYDSLDNSSSATEARHTADRQPTAHTCHGPAPAVGVIAKATASPGVSE